MFRTIRRKKNEISAETAKQLLKQERRGIISMQGDDGYPYAVPVNFLYCEEEGKIYFHGSRAGHKADSIRKNEKVCFTVYGNETIKDEVWAPYLQSTVVFGRCRILTDPEKAQEKLRMFAGKYYPDAASVEEEISVSGKAVCMYEITIEHLSGKQIQER